MTDDTQLTEHDSRSARMARWHMDGEYMYDTGGCAMRVYATLDASAARHVQSVRQALEQHADLKAALIGVEGEWSQWEGAALNAEQAARWRAIERETNLDGQVNSFWTYVMAQVQRLLREDTHAAE